MKKKKLLLLYLLLNAFSTQRSAKVAEFGSRQTVLRKYRQVITVDCKFAQIK